jgi:hypothetical protein
MVISSIFPPGTPVWYNFRESTTSSERITHAYAYEGVVRAVSKEGTGEFIYEVVRKNLLMSDSDVQTICTDCVHECNIAFGYYNSVFYISEQLVSSAHDALTIDRPTTCKNKGCNRHMQENCDGYCFAHHCFFIKSDWSLYYQRDRTDEIESNSSSNKRLENTSQFCHQQTVIDLTEDADGASVVCAKTNNGCTGYI